jgi:hypothetical protein
MSSRVPLTSTSNPLRFDEQLAITEINVGMRVQVITFGADSEGNVYASAVQLALTR